MFSENGKENTCFIRCAVWLQPHSILIFIVSCHIAFINKQVHVSIEELCYTLLFIKHMTNQYHNSERCHVEPGACITVCRGSRKNNLPTTLK